jgi:hypothetical protein
MFKPEKELVEVESAEQPYSLDPSEKTAEDQLPNEGEGDASMIGDLAETTKLEDYPLWMKDNKFFNMTDEITKEFLEESTTLSYSEESNSMRTPGFWDSVNCTMDLSYMDDPSDPAIKKIKKIAKVAPVYHNKTRQIHLKLPFKDDTITPKWELETRDNHDYYNWKKWGKKAFLDKFKVKDLEYSTLFVGKHYAKLNFKMKRDPNEPSQHYLTWFDCEEKLGWFYIDPMRIGHHKLEVLNKAVVFKSQAQEKKKEEEQPRLVEA